MAQLMILPTMAGVFLDLYALHDRLLESTNPPTPAEARMSAGLDAWRSSKGAARRQHFWAIVELLEPYARESLPPEAAQARKVLLDAQFAHLMISSYGAEE
ncbi:hypothetical protein ACIP93_33710 [Streptomyces sp. NPDC088745]|uniref:hypothetical protein n=1 Tax=Streptomyces sp. NPDC088745 TaxID=3365884 RepID=UPI003818DCC4